MVQQSQPCAVCGGATSYTPDGAAADGVWFYPGVEDRACLDVHCEGADPKHQWRLLPEDPALADADAPERELTDSTDSAEGPDHAGEG